MSGPILTAISALDMTVQLTGDVAAHRFVNVAGAQAQNAERAIGVARNDEKAGRAVSVGVLGVFDMIAGGNLAAGSEVQSDGDGLPRTLAAGVANGVALTSADPGGIVKILIK